MAKGPKPAVQTTNQTQSGTTNSTQSVTPWSGAIPILNQFAGGAGAAYDATNKTGFTGPLFAGLNPTQTGANDALLRLAPSLAAGAPQINQLASDTISGRYLDPSSNPWLAQTGQVITHTANDNLTRNILPALADSAIRGGAYGGAGYGVGQGIAAGDTSRAISDALTQMYGQNYTTERANQMAAPALFGQANALSLQPAQIMAAVGANQQTNQQGQLDANLAQYQMQQQAPWNGLSQLAAALGALNPYATTTSSGTTNGTVAGTQTGTPAQPSATASGLSGALGGASAGATFGPWGAGIGAILGGLGGLFG